MKIRNGFVSNSSSSSFIVAWDKKPTSVEEIHQILFKGSEKHYYWDDPFDAKQLSQIILTDTTEATEEEIRTEQSNMFCYDSWGTNPHWYSTGYKPNNELLKRYEVEYKQAKELLKVCEDLLKAYTKEEIETFKRKNKLERIVGEESNNPKEKEYYRITKQLESAQDIVWRDRGLFKEIVDESTREFLKDYADKFISIYHYSDNNGEIEACLEHSDVFKPIDSWCISKH